ncbi:Peptidase, M23/M37 family protein [Candidatus Arthromitus sp. SFB-mouse-SU]|uniref:murein hydrolase activator EnvC family protein n=1 Tax=Candidatus Arthromitus sp. SFB-mouse TaxID=49118 RepID=UPI00022967AB|nr:peptidoglycan DD-metalloendopeptidase family protein [Candidatus Arthromitus sp. SFB-mouse]EGX29255.1 M23/M37 family peptidase [Candidatus Arthromitus sp. SFB-mouse-NYU]EIA29439.1 Peptidase, M23/M37 family protein [Candidatus Arthromitus sp. SFB-co]EIA30345.1 Peptidase, M23/M37 family protein [Candidatus Arthromitus sp. SFB-mouse-SU]BAK79416.1 peptidase, M23/M37 family protein [Candidatus Arthromitus sp. SFB-mouse-Yit]
MNKNKTLRLSVFLIIVFIFVVNSDAMASVKDSLEQQIQQNNEKIDNVQNEIYSINEEIDAIDDELSKIKSEIDQRNGVINEYLENIELHQKNIDDKALLIDGIEKQIITMEENIEKLNKEIENNQAELVKLEAILADRIKEFYKYSQNNSLGLDLFFSMVFDMNKDLQDVLDTVHSMSKITESDRKLIENIKQIKDNINRDKENLEKEVQSLALYRKDLENQIQEIENSKNELIVKKNELDAELQVVRDLEREYQERYDALDEDSKRKREELINIQQDNEQLQQQLTDYLNSINNSGLVGGSNEVSPSGYLRPSTGPVTSEYGWRVHPIRGTKSLHTGTDFGGKIGDTIIASRAGEVVFAGWYNNVYGNVVILNHGGGYQTFYAHMSRVAVSEGQVVDQGVRIGYMGSTGMSTGAHLHFEIRKDGVSLDPFNFLSR